jgi:hypothetical protein
VVDYSDIENLRAVVENHRRESITEEEWAELRSWYRGRELRLLVDMTGYGIMMDKISGFMDEHVAALLNTPPGDDQQIRIAHSTAYAAHRLLTRLTNEVQFDIQSSETTPMIAREANQILRGTPMPPDFEDQQDSSI